MMWPVTLTTQTTTYPKPLLTQSPNTVSKTWHVTLSKQPYHKYKIILWISLLTEAKQTQWCKNASSHTIVFEDSSRLGSDIMTLHEL